MSNTHTTAILTGYETSLEVAIPSIRNWNEALRNAAQQPDGVSRITELFSSYNGFVIPQGVVLPNTTEDDRKSIHVYIGINDQGNPEFFVLNGNEDNKDGITEINTIFRFDGKSISSGDDYQKEIEHITDREAARRIISWSYNNATWIEGIFNDGKALFNAWEIPWTDLNTQVERYIHFGLNVAEETTTSGLIIEWVGTHETFYDLVRPVPPFKSGEMVEYGLLMKALS